MMLNIPYEIIDLPTSLSLEEQNVLNSALKACDDAWAPYSNFQVGCAILMRDGSIVIGNNQENRAFPSGLCAERVALFHAGAIGKGNQILIIAIRASSKQKPVNVPISPCGACRQVMLDYEKQSGAPVTVLMQGESGQILKVKGIADVLLPFAFDFEF